MGSYLKGEHRDVPTPLNLYDFSPSLPERPEEGKIRTTVTDSRSTTTSIRGPYLRTGRDQVLCGPTLTQLTCREWSFVREPTTQECKISTQKL